MLLPSNVSTNVLASPSSVEGAAAGLLLTVPSSGSSLDHEKNFALVTSLLLCNKTSSEISVWAKIVNGSQTAKVMHSMKIPAGIPYDLIHGNKLTLKQGDNLYMWHNNTVDTNPIDVVLSYTLHKPLTVYEI